MLYAGKIGLRRIGEQIGAGRIGLIQKRIEPRRIQPQFGHHQGRVLNRGAFGARELANAVDGVVVVEREQITAARRKRKGFAKEFQRRRGILREDEDILFGARMEIAEDVPARAFDVLGHLDRSGACGMRIAQDAGTQQVEMLLQLRFGVERAAGVVEVHLFAFVQAAVLGRAKIVQQRRLLIVRIAREKVHERFFGLRLFLCGALRHVRHFIPSAPALRMLPGRFVPIQKVVPEVPSRCSLSGVGNDAELR